MDGAYEFVVRWFPVLFGLWFALPHAALALKVWLVPTKREKAQQSWAAHRPGEPLPGWFVRGGVLAACAIAAGRALFYGTLSALAMRVAFIAGAWLADFSWQVFACAWGLGPCGGA